MKVSTLAGLMGAVLPAVMAQTYNFCNPLSRDGKNATIEATCKPLDCQYALGKTITWDFRKGPSEYIPSEPWFPPEYKSDGVHLIVKQTKGNDKADSPAIVTGHRIMWGRLDARLKVAPGKGIVSSLVLLSSTLDEIDWEWLGGEPFESQSNYFGKGDTQQPNRGQKHHSSSDVTKNFHNYGIEWDTNTIKWEIDGEVVRTMDRAEAKSQYTPDPYFGPNIKFKYPNYYPETPMQIKIGSWAGGDPSNEPGTIEWAGGETDFSKGPFAMVVESVTITDFTTGAGRYCYTEQSLGDGSFETIKIDKDTPFQPAPVPIEGGPVEKKKTTTTKASTLSTTTKTTTSAKTTSTPDEEEEEEDDDDDSIAPHITQGMPDSLGDLDGPQNKGVSNTEGAPSETAAGAEQTGEPSSASSVRTAGFGGLILAMVASFVLL